MLLETRNDLPRKIKEKEVDLLNQRLADTLDLVYQAKQAHWNVKGMEFRSLHKLFDEAAEKLEPYVDLFAERLVQLGGVTEGTIQCVAKNSSLREYPIDIFNGRDHLEALCERVAQYAATVRECIQTCADLGDQVTSDLCTDATRDADELSWMLESHLVGVAKSDGKAKLPKAA